MYFEIDDIISAYGPDYVDEYGVLLDYNKDAKLKKVAVYLTQEGNLWRRAIACVGEGIEYATYVPYLSNDGTIKYTGLNSAWINTFSLSENSSGIWCYSNYATIGVNLEDAYGKLLLSLYDIGQAGVKTRIFDNLDEMIAWLIDDSTCIYHTEGEWIIEKEANCGYTGLKYYICSECGDKVTEVIPTVGEHVDENRDHYCDVCVKYIGTHSDKDGDGDHLCDYCNSKISECFDNNQDGVCDECATVMYSVGLNYSLNSDGQSYTVTGIGTCADTNLIIPSTYNGLPVTAIKNFAFRGCEKLTSVMIPDSVTNMGVRIFMGCTNLTSIIVDKNNSTYKSIDGNVYTIDGKTLVIYAAGKAETSFVIPNGVTNIGEGAFYICDNLVSVTISDSVVSIGDYAFSSCDRLENVTIGNGVTIIGEYAFAYCDALIVLTIGNNVTSIGSSAFNGCDSLTNVIIPDSVNSIESFAFYYCKSLASITIGNRVQFIDSYAFAYSAITSIMIPRSVSSIAEETFVGCTKLTNIIVDENNSHYKSIDGNLYTKDEKTLVRYAAGKSDTSFVIFDTVTSIGAFAFESCYNLTIITIPNTVTSIGRSAFDDCRKLTSIIIPDSVTSLGYMAFSGCESLENVTIGNNVTSLGYNVFAFCERLTSIIIPYNVTSISNKAFYECNNLMRVEFKNTSGWYVLLHMEDFEKINLPDLANAEIAAEYLVRTYVDGKWYCELPTYSEGLEFSLNDDGQSYTVIGIGSCTDTELLIPTTHNGLPVTAIGEWAFENNDTIVTVTIPSSVKKIGMYAFYMCRSLRSITLCGGTYEECMVIEYEAFSYIDSLTSITFLSGCFDIWGIDNDNLTTIYIGADVTYIHGLEDCYFDSLTEIIVDEENPVYKSIDGNLYSEDGRIFIRYANAKTDRYFTLPEGVEIVGRNAFAESSNLVYLTFPVTVYKIYDHAFQNCTNLVSLSIPGYIDEVGSDIFRGLYNLTSLRFEGIGRLPSEAFRDCFKLAEIITYESPDLYEFSHFTIDLPNGEHISLRDHVLEIHDGEESKLRNEDFCFFYDVDNGIQKYLVNYISDGSNYRIYMDEIIIRKYALLGVEYDKLSFDYCECVLLKNGYFCGSVSDEKIILEDLLANGWTIEELLLHNTTYAGFDWVCHMNHMFMEGECRYCGKSQFILDRYYDSETGTEGYVVVGMVEPCYVEEMEYITIPDDYKGLPILGIGYEAFRNNSVLYYLHIGDNVTFIESHAFENCSGLELVSFGRDLAYIGMGAFMGCDNLREVVMYNTSDWVMYFDEYIDVGESIDSHLLSGEIETAEFFKNHMHCTFKRCKGPHMYMDLPTCIERPRCETCGAYMGDYNYEYHADAPNWTITDTTHTKYYPCCGMVEIENENHEYEDGYCVKCDHARTYSMGLNYDLNSDKQSYAVTGIGSCTDTELIIPPTYNGLPVTSIGEDAFREADNITKVIIGDNVTNIGRSSFYCCDNLVSVVIGDNVKNIEDWAFGGCYNLTTIVIPDSVTSIGRYAFLDCTALTNVTIGNGVTTIGDYAFYGCDSLVSVTFNNTSDWFVSTDSNATSGTDIASAELANTATAAEYLKSTYYNNYWFRREAE